MHQSNSKNLVFHQSEGAIWIVNAVAHHKRLMWPGALVAAMDLFCFYKGRLLLEGIHFYD